MVTYGLGGSSIIAPFCVAICHLTIYTVARASAGWHLSNIGDGG